MNPSLGFLPYGSDDASVIFRRSLTKLPPANPVLADGDIGTCASVTVTGTADWDADDGFMLLTNGTNDGVVLATLTNAALLNPEGQIRFQVQTALIAADPSVAYGSSGGVAAPGNQGLIGWRSDADTNGSHRGSVTLNAKSIAASFGYGSNIAAIGGGANTYFNDAKSGAWTDIVITWSGRSKTLYVDGVWYGAVSDGAHALTTQFNTFVLGRHPSAGSNYPLVSGRIRNLQISTKPVIFQKHPLLAHVHVFGDSYASSVFAMSAANWFNMGAGAAFRGHLHRAGYTYGQYSQDSNSGASIIANGTNDLDDFYADCLNNYPTLVVLQAGANDLTETGSLNAASFESSLKGHIEYLMGLNGNAATTVKAMVINSTPWAPQYGSGGSGGTVPDEANALLRLPDILTIRNIVMDIPAWFDATYPTLAGHVVAFDMYAHFGNATENFGMSTADVYDYLHPNDLGHYVKAEGWAQGVLSLVRKFST